MATSYFEITKRGRRPNYSLPLSPTPDASLAAGTIVSPRGTAFMESATLDTSALADGTVPFLGFTTRHMQVGGPPLGDSIYPGRIDLATVAGQEATYEHAEEVEAEGSDFIIGSGSNKIDNGTALKTKLSFSSGKFCAAQTGQYAEYMLVAKPTARDTGNVVRIRAQKIEGQLV